MGIKRPTSGFGRRCSEGWKASRAGDGADQLEASSRTPSSSSSAEGPRRSRTGFTQSFAKLGREALENLQDLQTAAQRAFSGQPLPAQRVDLQAALVTFS